MGLGSFYRAVSLAMCFADRARCTWRCFLTVRSRTLGIMCLSRYFRNLSMNNGRTEECTLLCPIPLINRGSARYGSIIVSNNRSEWLKGTMLSLVPCINNTGDLIDGAKSTFGNLSPGRVQPLSNTIRYTDKKGACKTSPATASPSSAVLAAR